MSELAERKIAAEDQLNQVDLRAPQSGRVHQLAVHTVGGVIGPGETLMLIVPGADNLRLDARVSPTQIDEVKVGQPALLRFSAFNQRVTPEIKGEVTRVGADIETDQKTGAMFYTARISITEQELSKLGNVRVIPGMPVETFIQTSSRTVLSYLIKPLTDQMQRALRER